MCQHHYQHYHQCNHQHHHRHHHHHHRILFRCLLLIQYHFITFNLLSCAPIHFFIDACWCCCFFVVVVVVLLVVINKFILGTTTNNFDIHEADEDIWIHQQQSLNTKTVFILLFYFILFLYCWLIFFVQTCLIFFITSIKDCWFCWPSIKMIQKRNFQWHTHWSKQKWILIENVLIIQCLSVWIGYQHQSNRIVIW